MPKPPRRYPFKVGVELEFFVTKKNGLPIMASDLLADLFEEAKRRGYAGTFVPDAAYDQAEMVLAPTERLSDIAETLRQLHDLMPQGLEWHFVNRRPGMNGAPAPWLSLPRLSALQEALAEECPHSWKGVLRMADYCALHVTFGIDPCSPEGLAMLWYFNLVSPWLSRHVAKQWGIDNRGHLATWRGWADPRRFTDPRRKFSSSEELITHIESTTCLISYEGPPEEKSNKHSIGWVVDRKRRMKYGDADDERAGMWWKTRARGSVCAIETRESPSCTPETAPQIIGLKCDVALMLISETAGRCFESAHDFSTVFERLHRRFPFLPPKPPSSEEYWAAVHT